MKLTVYKKHIDALLPVFKTSKSACCDLFTLEEYYIKPLETVLLRTGLVIVPPEGYHLQLYPRSSLMKGRAGLILSNSVGQIDEDYIGIDDEIKISLYNSHPTNMYKIDFRERIAQLELRKTIQCDIEEIYFEDIQNNRERGGFGSTGKF